MRKKSASLLENVFVRTGAAEPTGLGGRGGSICLCDLLSKPDKHREGNGQRKLEIISCNEQGDSEKDTSHCFTNFFVCV